MASRARAATPRRAPPASRPRRRSPARGLADIALGVDIDLATLWAFVIAFAVFVYVVMDGFDLGLGILFPLFRHKHERDVVMNSVAPVWDGNEVWLVVFGGATFASQVEGPDEPPGRGPDASDRWRARPCAICMASTGPASRLPWAARVRASASGRTTSPLPSREWA